jgi:hypothetical protein
VVILRRRSGAQGKECVVISIARHSAQFSVDVLLSLTSQLLPAVQASVASVLLHHWLKQRYAVHRIICVTLSAARRH